MRANPARPIHSAISRALCANVRFGGTTCAHCHAEDCDSAGTELARPYTVTSALETIRTDVGFAVTDETRLRALLPKLSDSMLPAGLDACWLQTLFAGPWDDRYYADRVVRVRGFTNTTEIVRALHTVRISLTEIVNDPVIHTVLDFELALMMHLYDLESRRWQTDQRAAIQTLSSGFAHELRNPLNSAKLLLDVLERRLRRHMTNGDVSEPAARARHEIERLCDLVEDFLAYAQPPPLAPTQCDVVTLVEHVVEVEQVFAEEHGVELRLTPPSSRVYARVDADKIRQLVKNLVRNALEAAPAGGHVTVCVTADHGVVHIHVTDDGPGISDTVRARMFEPFYSTKDTGTGLGMSIVQSIVTMHGGTIGITTGSAGTALDVSLPRASA